MYILELSFGIGLSNYWKITMWLCIRKVGIATFDFLSKTDRWSKVVPTQKEENWTTRHRIWLFSAFPQHIYMDFCSIGIIPWKLWKYSALSVKFRGIPLSLSTITDNNFLIFSAKFHTYSVRILRENPWRYFMENRRIPWITQKIYSRIHRIMFQ